MNRLNWRSQIQDGKDWIKITGWFIVFHSHLFPIKKDKWKEILQINKQMIWKRNNTKYHNQCGKECVLKVGKMLLKASTQAAQSTWLMKLKLNLVLIKSYLYQA